MNDLASNGKEAEMEDKGKLGEQFIPWLMILLVIALTVFLFLYRGRIAELGHYGYVGAFLVSLITSATIVLPVPGIVVLIALGANLNPVLVGLVGATGGMIGEMTGFIFGYGGQKVVQSKNRLYLRAEKWMRRWGSLAVFAFAVAPLPLFDLAGIVAGALRYPLWKFLLVGWVGKSIKMVLLVVTGVWGWAALLRLFD